jgi:uncharacterized membrane protein YcaP (DUF421 family)
LTAILLALFGRGQDLAVHQMCARVLVVYALVVVYIRVAGRRTFGHMATFDNVISILLGAILSRAVVGSSPFVPVIASGLVLVLLQRAAAWAAMASPRFRRLVQGEPETVYADGAFLDDRLRAHRLCREDVLEGVREQVHTGSMRGVDRVVIERNGKLAVIELEDE